MMRLNQMATKICIPLAVAAAVTLTFEKGFAADGQPVTASALIRSCLSQEVLGMATLRERKSDEGVKFVKVTLKIKGLNNGGGPVSGKRAVHIHETGSCVPCGSAGGHFDPGPNTNTNPDGNHPFHSGDLINVNLRNGNGVLRTQTTRITLSPGPLSLFDGDGSAFIVHVNPDTYCPDGAVAGCAGGGREACGVIELD